MRHTHTHNINHENDVSLVLFSHRVWVLGAMLVQLNAEDASRYTDSSFSVLSGVHLKHQMKSGCVITPLNKMVEHGVGVLI